jgi:hypothetical protein
VLVPEQVSKLVFYFIEIFGKDLRMHEHHLINPQVHSRLASLSIVKEVVQLGHKDYDGLIVIQFLLHDLLMVVLLEQEIDLLRIQLH